MQLFRKSQAIPCSSVITMAFLIACHNTPRKQTPVDTTHTKADTTNIRPNIPQRTWSAGHDTTINISIDGLSAEGSEVIARYRQGRITKVQWNIYGETGRCEINYVFGDSMVTAEEVRYTYKKQLTEVKTDADIAMGSKQTYLLPVNDTPGRMPIDKEHAELFAIFKKSVAFTL
jgi:hypothetical protein